MGGHGGEFYTVRGYELLHQQFSLLTPGMEDYLEMAYRLARDKGYTRIGLLSNALNVQPPSASKMVQKLAEAGYMHYEKYGMIELTEEGRQLGTYLLRRHETIAEFLSIIGVTQDILEETEKIEHYLSMHTVQRIMILVECINNNKDLLGLLGLNSMTD